MDAPAHLNPRVLVVKRPQDLPAGWTRKAPHPVRGLDTGEWWRVVDVGESMIDERYDVIVLTQRAWAFISENERSAQWYSDVVETNLAPGGCALWLWADGS